MASDTGGAPSLGTPARPPLGHPGIAWHGDGALARAARGTPASGAPAHDLPAAPLARRAAAFVLDSVLTFVLSTFAGVLVVLVAGIDPTLPQEEMQRALEPLTPLVNGLALLVYVVYQAASNATGGSPGKRTLGLRIVDAEGNAPGLWRGVLRALWSLLSAVPPWLGYLAVTWNADRRAWHDRLSGTWVVRARGE